MNDNTCFKVENKKEINGIQIVEGFMRWHLDRAVLTTPGINGDNKVYLLNPKMVVTPFAKFEEEPLIDDMRDQFADIMRPYLSKIFMAKNKHGNNFLANKVIRENGGVEAAKIKSVKVIPNGKYNIIEIEFLGYNFNDNVVLYDSSSKANYKRDVIGGIEKIPMQVRVVLETNNLGASLWIPKNNEGVIEYAFGKIADRVVVVPYGNLNSEMSTYTSDKIPSRFQEQMSPESIAPFLKGLLDTEVLSSNDSLIERIITESLSGKGRHEFPDSRASTIHKISNNLYGIRKPFDIYKS